MNLGFQIDNVVEAEDRGVLELVEPSQDVPRQLGQSARLHGLDLPLLALYPGDDMGRPFDLNVLHLVLRIGRQEHLKQLLESLLQSLQDVGDCNVSKALLEQDDITMPAFAMGGALVIQTGEVIVSEPISKRFG